MNKRQQQKGLTNAKRLRQAAAHIDKALRRIDDVDSVRVITDEGWKLVHCAREAADLLESDATPL